MPLVSLFPIRPVSRYRQVVLLEHFLELSILESSVRLDWKGVFVIAIILPKVPEYVYTGYEALVTYLCFPLCWAAFFPPMILDHVLAADSPFFEDSLQPLSICPLSFSYRTLLSHIGHLTRSPAGMNVGNAVSTIFR